MTLPLAFFYSIEQAGSLVGSPFDTNSFELRNAGNNYVASAMRFNGGSPPDSASFDISSLSLGAGYIDVGIEAAANATADRPVIVLSGASTDLLRISVINASEHWMVEYWNGSAWTQIGSDITATPLSTASKITIGFDLDNAAGEFIVSQNGAVVASLTSADTLTTADTTIDFVTLQACATAATTDTFFWMLIVDDADTTTLFVDERFADANGGETDWSGGEPEIDEYINAADEANFISADANLERETFAFESSAAAIAAYTVEAVVLAIRARATADPGLYVQGIARKSATNYEGDNSVQPAAGAFANYNLEFEVDPDGGGAWASVAAVENYELGLQAQSIP